MITRLSMVSLLIAGVLVGIVLSGRATDQPDVIARTAPPADAAATTTEQAAAPMTSAGPDFTRVAAQTVRAVTNISSVQVVRRSASPFANDPFFQYFFGDQGEMFGRNRAEQSLGSGVVISPDGFVVTNNHVIGNDVAEVTVTVGDQRDVKARIIGVDSWTDLALLKIDGSGLPVIPWGDSSKLKVAEWVMAVGNPFSLNQTVTLGVVSALGRANVGITQYEDFIQTDAAINPGNSGGALINSRGELVGINTAIFSQSGGYQGIGFAVPSNLVRRVLDDLQKFGRVRRGSIGYVEVIPLSARLADELRAPRTDGVVVNQMSRESSAYRAGLEPGDIVVSVNGTTIADPSQFVRIIADSTIGSTLRIDILREGRRQTLRVPVEQLQERRVRRR
ncbi:MAG TPA: trypsin-like peptidase domain-containing protein [Vicinamibacterales bacterium]|nr:trypsin-like peptidase domain-containing protein [Vicinamibacterales bacterium]